MIGIDIVEIARISVDEEFLNRIAFKEEADYILSVSNAKLQKQRTAGLWAVKEAVMKALGLGQKSGVSFKDIKLNHLPSGKPIIEVYGIAKKEFDKNYKGKNIEVSISHTLNNATAIAMII